MNDKVLSIIIKAQDQASRVLDDVGNKSEGMGTKIAKSAALAAKVTGVALAGGIALAAKASLDQVSAVQQATVALSAYEPNAAKVNNVLSDLVKYARSDLGVLFNRKDLFDAAQSLKIMGDNTDNLVGHVEIMSRSVGLGLSNWDDLNQIVGRVGSTGRLTGDDFDNLTKAGYRLDPALRNTNVSFDQLFDAMNKGIPVNALEGQANTIHGMGIRFQTAFRGIGNAILGVDADTNKFIKGGLGDQLVRLFGNITNAMKTDQAKGFFSAIGTGAAAIGTVISAAVPYIVGLVRWLESMRNGFSQAWNWIQNMLSPSLHALGSTISERLLPAFSRFLPILGFIAVAIGVAVVLAVYVLINVLNILISVLSWCWQVVMNVANAFVDAWHRVQGAWSTAVGFFSSIASGISGALGRVPGIISGAFSAGFNAVKGMISDILGDIAALPGKIASLLSGVGGAIRKSIGNIDLPGPLGKISSVIPGFASGVQNFSGGLALVGEQGPELVNLPAGSSVYSNSQSQGMMGATINIYGNITNSTPEAANAFWDRVDQTTRMAKIGMA